MSYVRYPLSLCCTVFDNLFFSVLSELRQEELPGVAWGCRQNMAGINGGGDAAKCSLGFCRALSCNSCLVIYACEEYSEVSEVINRRL